MLLPPLPPVSDTLALLLQMRAVKFVDTQYKEYEWTAQATGRELWGHGPTPIDAMKDALCKSLKK